MRTRFSGKMLGDHLYECKYCGVYFPKDTIETHKCDGAKGKRRREETVRPIMKKINELVLK